MICLVNSVLVGRQKSLCALMERAIRYISKWNTQGVYFYDVKNKEGKALCISVYTD